MFSDVSKEIITFISKRPIQVLDCLKKLTLSPFGDFPCEELAAGHDGHDCGLQVDGVQLQEVDDVAVAPEAELKLKIFPKSHIKRE